LIFIIRKRETNMDFTTKYNEFVKLIEIELEKAVPDKKPRSLYEPFKYILQGGGKRIRPVLSMIACGAAGGNPEDMAKIGAAVEILHNFTLVHDDIMDESPIRRGRETIHNKWNNAVGILTGDLMVSYSCRMLPNHLEHDRCTQIHDLFTTGYIEVCEGQGHDMDFNFDKSVTIDDYIMMITKKTSWLLITAAMCGGHYALADETKLNALYQYALYLGLGFQIQDDLLDISADESKFGKKIGRDIIEGKKTYLIVKAKEKVDNERDKELLDMFFERNGLGSDYIPAMKELFERNGILNDAETESEKYFQKAKDALNNLDDNEYTKMLGWLLDSLNKRAY
jgi:geranylgeranyl diphosphate synthase type II